MAVEATLFNSDHFIQPGHGKASTDEDLSDQMVNLYNRIGLTLSMGNIRAAMDKLRDLDIKTIVCHQGSALTGNLAPYYVLYGTRISRECQGLKPIPGRASWRNDLTTELNGGREFGILGKCFPQFLG